MSDDKIERVAHDAITILYMAGQNWNIPDLIEFADTLSKRYETVNGSTERP